jgi:hypothetical protein
MVENRELYSYFKLTIQQQQQQQHSLLSQASWGRLEMKPKRDEKYFKLTMRIQK